MKLEIKNLTKVMSKNRVIDNVSFDFYGGRVYGLKGKNGSGKTMLMRAICGLVKPTSGEIYIDGKRLGKDISFPESVGALIENPAFISKYSGFKNLKTLALIQNKITDDDICAALKRVGLNPHDDRSFRKYSLGMKQRLGVAAAIMEAPDLILLDEPINALDDDGVALINKLLHEERERGALIIVSAHDKEELYMLSDEVLTISQGSITDSHLVKKDFEEQDL